MASIFFLGSFKTLAFCWRFAFEVNNDYHYVLCFWFQEILKDWFKCIGDFKTLQQTGIFCLGLLGVLTA